MKVYTPFLVIGIFAVLLFLGTLIWTEFLFPENKSQRKGAQKEFEFKKTEQGHTELISSHR